jgi:hypothetical protein
MPSSARVKVRSPLPSDLTMLVVADIRGRELPPRPIMLFVIGTAAHS